MNEVLTWKTQCHTQTVLARKRPTPTTIVPQAPACNRPADSRTIQVHQTFTTPRSTPPRGFRHNQDDVCLHVHRLKKKNIFKAPNLLLVLENQYAPDPSPMKCTADKIRPLQIISNIQMQEKPGKVGGDRQTEGQTREKQRERVGPVSSQQSKFNYNILKLSFQSNKTAASHTHASSTLGALPSVLGMVRHLACDPCGQAQGPTKNVFPLPPCILLFAVLPTNSSLQPRPPPDPLPNYLRAVTL